MIQDYRLKDVEKLLKKRTDVCKEIFDAFDKITDAASIFAPALFGPQLLPAIELLTMKCKLIEFGKSIIDFISSLHPENYLERVEHIKAAYSLICYTAYFEALNKELPVDVSKRLKLKFESKQKLIESSDESLFTMQQNPDIHFNVFYFDHATSFNEIVNSIKSHYESISGELWKFIIESGIFNKDVKNDSKQLDILHTILGDLSSKAVEEYTAQYLYIANKFGDFAFFASTQEFNALGYKIEKQNAALEQLQKSTKQIDIGLANLNCVVNSISTNFGKIQVQNIIDELSAKYRDEIEKPIIEEQYIVEETGGVNLTFPKIVDAFIPQSYKWMQFRSEVTHLENNEIWSKLPQNNDLGNFFIKYLSSPDSINYPLVILGQPGSGKSLLTKVLCAQLMSESYTAIRIPLRDVDAESEIDVLIEEQIKKVTSRPLTVQGYGGFASEFSENTLVIILDGYDELLQARGAVYSGYLERVRKFQEEQKFFKRPVRIIVTSRISLINKVRIPLNSIILHLLDFDNQQIQHWIKIWNASNFYYFKASKNVPFILPDSMNGTISNLHELARQPLLLLMLAIFDSEGNELVKIDKISRTELYEKIIKKFVSREQHKRNKDFIDRSYEDQEQIIEKEMLRLGLVAIGMYNRQDVALSSKQLENDLEYFNIKQNKGITEIQPLQDSDSLIGGFFFIHKSITKNYVSQRNNTDSVFEFLHNTFGEFLAADFMVRHILQEIHEVYINRENNLLPALERKLSDPDTFSIGWFSSFMFVPLYSRPVIVEMLQEHANRKLLDFNFKVGKDSFLNTFNYIVRNQINMVINTRKSPKIMQNGKLLDRDISLINYQSTYSLNLIILSSILNSNGFEFCEEDYRPFEAKEYELRPWNKLISLWKTSFALADLAGLAAILKATRISEELVIIKHNARFEAVSYEQPIDIQLCVSITLAENLMTGILGLHTPNLNRISRLSIDEYRILLAKEDNNLYISFLFQQIRKIVWMVEFDKKNYLLSSINLINNYIKAIMDNVKSKNSIDDNNALEFLELIDHCLMLDLVQVKNKIQIFEHVKDSYYQLNKETSNTALKYLINGIVRRILNNIADDYSLSIYLTARNSYVQMYNPEEHSGSINNIDLVGTDAWRAGTYSPSLLNILNDEVGSMQETDKYKLLLSHILYSDIEAIQNTNPGSVLKAILYLIDRNHDGNLLDNKDGNDIRQIVGNFYSVFFDTKLPYVGLEVTTDLLQIARLLQMQRIESQLVSFLNSFLSPGYLIDIMLIRPDLLLRTINLLPQPTIDCLLRGIVEKSVNLCKNLFNPDRIFEYFQLLEKIDTISNSRIAKKHKAAELINQLIDWWNPDWVTSIDLHQISINHLLSIRWWIEFRNDTKMLKSLKTSINTLINEIQSRKS